MTPTLTPSHVSAGRTRLRANGGLGGAAAFEEVAAGLSRLRGVERVEANPLTRSILVLHAVPFEELASAAQSQGLAEIAAAPPPRRRIRPERRPHRPHTEADRAEARQAMSGLGAVSLLGLSIFQAARGDVLPAALPLFMQALILFRHERPPEPLG